ncbi:lmo0937 family membrane protein [Bacillus sp. M6-12]|nr:lmo0937 family membrane protein [Bacillus sp. M6-12]
MLWTIIGVLLLLWVAGLVFDIAGGLIHLLLIIAAVVFVFSLIKGRAKR